MISGNKIISTAYYRGREISIRQIGQKLDADYVVEGSVWETGKRLRLSVQPSETASDHLRAYRSEIHADQVGDFQDEVAHEIRHPHRAGT